MSKRRYARSSFASEGLRLGALVLAALPEVDVAPDPDDNPLFATALVGEADYLVLPKNIQRQASRKMETIEAASESAGYPLRKPLQGFRGIHSGHYRIVWRFLTLEEGEIAAEVVYVGIRSEGNQRDAYAELQKPFNTLEL